MNEIDSARSARPNGSVVPAVSNERGDTSPRPPFRIASALDLATLPQLISTRVIPYVVHQLNYVGRVGVAGIALFVASAVWFLSANSTLRHQVSESTTKITNLRHSRAGSPDVVATTSPQARLTTLVSSLPKRAELPVVTEQIVAQAAAAGLVLERGTYAVTVTRSGRVARARLTFPVHGRYPDIRRFIDGTLAAISGAAVDGLQFQRKEISATEIDAEIRFAVYLRDAT